MTHETILSELEDYCRRAGLKPSTVCVRALNDSRYPARYRRKLASLEGEAARLRKYMADHPAPDGNASGVEDAA